MPAVPTILQIETALCLIWPVIFLVGIASTAFWIWMLIDCLQKEFDGDEKVIWVLVIILAGIVGAIVYYFVGKPKGRRPG